MNEESIRQLQDHLDERNGAALPAGLQEELERDEGLRALWEELRAADELLSCNEAAPASLHAGIMDRIEQAPGPRRPAKARVLLLAPVAAAAAVVLFVALHFETTQQPVVPPPRRNQAPPVETAADVSLPRLSLSVEWSAPREFVIEKRDRAIESAEGLIAGVAKVLPRRPDEKKTRQQG